MESAMEIGKRRIKMRNACAVILVLTIVFLCPLFSGGTDHGEASPKVVATNPVNGAVDVDPSLSRVAVIFNEQMMDKSWSWSYENKESFPQMAGQPHYTDNATTCVLPVKLEPGKTYVIWINTQKFKNFKDIKGTPVEPYKLMFTTRKR